MDEPMEREHLALAQRHIREGRARVRQQIALVRVLRSEGHAQLEAQALRLLAAQREWVSAARQHRALIDQVLAGSAAWWPRTPD